MVRVKTSIYVDRDLWERFKRHARRKGLETSHLLERVLEEEIAEDEIDEALLKLAGSEVDEIDFEPVEPRRGLVSELVRVVRDEGSGSISGH
ncbi:MAG: hypothetical protein GSR82_01270 [Desulfurococcales archaeon]|nr:hypothetical protein [Desulfurococcales archaeon]